ncbi:MAG TPA: AAA family ATPase [Pyrinomonadaceae bacterium]|nr:AAA family ATPase [Pyrinomonadaceae bacterium]
MIVHINGMPGVGKLTVAKTLATKLNFRLIDNHLLIDLVTTVWKHGSAEYLSMLKKITGVVLEEIAKKPNEIFIFTNALSAELEEDRERFDRLSGFAKDKNIPFVQIFLDCDLEENQRRIVSEERKTKGKLMNADELEEIHKNYTIYHPPTKFALIINITNLSAEEVSGQIESYVEKISM